MVTVFENQIYSVKTGCIIELMGVAEIDTYNVILMENEQFRVEPYTGYDVYGQDYVDYKGKRYLLYWDKNVLESLTEI